jgi:4-hydroxy-3-polyprenylbenzoate decarboxylase
MAFQDLREFLAALEKSNELQRIPFEVNPHLEITEFADRAVKVGGPALLFEKTTGSQFPLAINLFASDRRMQIALGVNSLDEIAGRITDYLQLKMPAGLIDKLKMLPMLADVGKFFPKQVSSGPVKEVIQKDKFTLDDFPILHCWPQDGGRYITLPLVFSKNPDTGKRNCGMYRMQVYDGQTTGMHWQLHKQGAEHYRRLLEEGKTQRMDVAVAIGADPATMYSAILPLPPELDEMMIAGFLRSKPVEMVQCETVDLEVPAHAEIVLEGYVQLGELRTEGPFGDHTGFYSLEDDYPVFHLTAITRRKDPIYCATIVGPPPMEDYWMGKSIEKIFLPMLRMQIPEVVAMSMPAEGVFHNLMLVAIKKRYPGHARKVMHAIWGLGQAMFTKCIVVVDEDVDVNNYSEVAWRVFNNIDPQRDTEFVMGPIDSLDHASRLPNYGSKMGIDGTKKWPSEGFSRPWPPVITMDPAVKSRVDDLWKRVGLDVKLK